MSHSALTYRLCKLFVMWSLDAILPAKHVLSKYISDYKKKGNWTQITRIRNEQGDVTAETVYPKTSLPARL